mmetsp:Transcript_107867/g.207388  ORF Transcript_107867/g.207388 Transcript_107867/m.207388 type:complete len:605 (+) Transcript_107867:55-1869(+)
MAVRPLEAPGGRNGATGPKPILRTSPTRIALDQRPNPKARRVLGSMPDSVLGDNLSAAAAAAAIVQAAQEEEERLVKMKAREEARAALVTLLRQQPGIYKALGIQRLGRSTTDAELLRAFSLVESIPKVLRMARTNPRDVADIMQLAPIAYQRPVTPPSKTQEEQNNEIALEQGRWFLLVLWVLGGFLVVAALALGSIAVIRMQMEADWVYGKCEINRFSAGHGNCSDKACGFDVFAWPNTERLTIAKTATRVVDWKMPLVIKDTTAESYVEGNAFRCCNLDLSFQCCGWYDKDMGVYCDDWVDKTDSKGQVCPETPWACRFQYATGSEDIERLEEASDGDPNLWLFGGLAIAAVCIAGLIAACATCRRCRILLSRFGTCVRQLCKRDRDVKIAELLAQEEAARLETLDPSSRASEEKSVKNRKPVRPPRPLPQRPLPEQQPQALEPGGSPAKRLSPVSEGPAPRAKLKRLAFSGTPTESPLRDGAKAEQTSPGEANDEVVVISPRLEVVDVAPEELTLPERGMDELLQQRAVHFPGLEESAVQTRELLRPIITPLPPRPYASTRSKRQKGGRKAMSWVHRDAEQGPESPGLPQGKEAWAVVDL